MATQDSSGINIGSYVSSLSILEWSRLCGLAKFTIIIYDIFLTLDEEIEFIWKARLSFGKAIFLVIRYFLVFSSIGGTLCELAGFFVSAMNLIKFPLPAEDMFLPSVTSNLSVPNKTLTSVIRTAWEDFEPFATFIVFFLTDVILQMRLYALFEGSKKILLVMAIPFVLVSMAALTELALYAVNGRGKCIPSTASPLPGISNFCGPLYSNSGGTYIYWAEMLFLETLFFVLACVKTYQSYRDEKLSGLSWQHSVSITHVLLRDSFVYYFGVFVTFLVNVIVSPLDDGRLQYPPSLFTSTISGVIGLRLILSVRKNFHAACEDSQKDDFCLSTWQAAPGVSPNPGFWDGSEDRPGTGSMSSEMARLPALSGLSGLSGSTQVIVAVDGDGTMGLEAQNAAAP
ncbi:hypothetical protein M0805_003596 [Coniferiporia weirii]|nr:hypothetical protein M0805_003596 [Coniferiporia weirii]